GNLFVPGDEHIENNSRWLEYRPIYNGTNFSFSAIGSGGENIRTMPGLNPPGGPSAPSRSGGDVAAVLISQLQPAKQSVLFTAGQMVDDAHGQHVWTAGLQNNEGSIGDAKRDASWSENQQGHYAYRGHVALLDELFGSFFGN